MTAIAIKVPYLSKCYHIYDKLADEQAHWKPTSFGFEVLGCKHTLEFPIAKLTDYHDQLDKLLVADNVFAVVTATHILTQRTRKNDDERYEAKRLLIKLLYQRNWDKQKVIDLFYVIDWMMRLPEAMEQQLWHEIETIEESKKMHYVTSVEKIGIAKGRQEGLLEGEAKMLSVMLKHRFGDLPDATVNKLMRSSEEQLKKWLISAISAATLDAVFSDELTH